MGVSIERDRQRTRHEGLFSIYEKYFQQALLWQIRTLSTVENLQAARGRSRPEDSSGKLQDFRRTQRASAREDLRRSFCAAANFKYQRGYRSRNSGVRSCRSSGAKESGSLAKIFPGRCWSRIFG